MAFKGQLFGPGLPSTGATVDFEATASGLRVPVADAYDATPRWDSIQISKSGWDGRQMRLEWRDSAGTYALTSGDAQVDAVIRKLAAGKAAVQTSRPDTATRVWAHALIWIAVVLPLLVAGAIVWQHQRIAAWAVNQITIEQEAKLGEMIFNQQKTRLKLVDGPALTMVREIGGRLTANSRYRYQFFVAEDGSVNAYAMPGGYVVMHTGLLQLAANAEEVAGVLAHEVQHVEQRHSLRGMAQALGLSAVLSLVVGDMGGLASLGGELVRLKFSRDHETEADREGLKLLVAAKIAPAGLRDFFAKMAAQSTLELGYLSTHPASAQRMADIDRLIKALPAEARNVPPLAYDYAAIKASTMENRKNPAMPFSGISRVIMTGENSVGREQQ